MSLAGALKTALGAYIKRAGAAIVMNEELDKDMVPLLLDLKDMLDNLISQVRCQWTKLRTPCHRKDSSLGPRRGIL
jgi:hypothetical protein